MGVVLEFPSDNLATYDEVYHCENCPCGSGSRWMSVSEFIIECFYPRQQKGRFKKERQFGGVRYPIDQPPRKEFIDNRYRDTDLDDNTQRHPILCSEAHDHWQEDSPNTPSSMQIVSDYTYTQLKKRIQNGDTFGGTHFKHWNGELPTCLCNDAVFGDDEEIMTRRRDEALSEVLSVEMCISSTIRNGEVVKWELGYFNRDSSELLKIDEIDYDADIQNFSMDKVSFWLRQDERRLGRLPFHCAGHITNESVEDSSRQIKIPDSGELVALIPASRFGEYQQRLISLKNAERIKENGSIISFLANQGDVKLYNKGKRFSHQGGDFYVATIKWNSSTISFVQEFMKECTGLDSQFVRRTNPVKIEIYDDDNELVTVTDANSPNRYRYNVGSSMKARVFRSRNRPLGSFLMRVGDNVNIDFRNPDSNRISITEYPPSPDGSKLFKMFVKSPLFQQGIWFELNCDGADDGTWFEVFDYKTSVEASGMRVELFEGD